MPDNDAQAPNFSLIVPAYNEEDELPATLPTYLAAMEASGRRGELIVVDNNSADRTAEIARDHGARVVFEEHNQISRARNAGAAAAHAPHLVFVDADTPLSAELLRAALENLESGECVGGGARLELDAYPRAGTRKAIAIWNRLARWRGLACGSFVYCLRDAFEAVGGFSLRVYAGEEVFFSRALRRWGRRGGLEFRVIQDPPIVSSARKFRWLSPWQLIWPTIMMVFFPYLILSRRCCGLWYKRPEKTP
ncbi:MAG: glycosyltransferase [Planctomycetota bacterium]|jgi:glycosyltransferase involved in cell wall biosynthesis